MEFSATASGSAEARVVEFKYASGVRTWNLAYRMPSLVTSTSPPVTLNPGSSIPSATGAHPEWYPEYSA